MNATEIKQRLKALRTAMEQHGVSAYIVPTADPHMSEYLPEYWKVRAWCSGFTGSAGTLLITAQEAGLWTDSRYFIQAEKQLQGSSIKLHKMALPETPSIETVISNSLKAGEKVGIDGNLWTYNNVQTLAHRLAEKQITLAQTGDLFEQIWTNRPTIPLNPVEIYPEQFAGKSAGEKLKQVRQTMKTHAADALWLSALDEIAWCLNLRGSDVECNPVFSAYLLIEETRCVLFANSRKISPEVATYLNAQGVELQPYTEAAAYMEQYTGHRLMADPDKTNFTLWKAMSLHNKLMPETSPIPLLKAVRNETEIEGLHHCMVRDGVALVHFLMWLEQAVPQGKETELSIQNKLHCCRAEMPLFKGESFDTITGYAAHGAIVHYSATEESNLPVESKGLLLIDSGAQYVDGTTDITRTIALGPLTEEEKEDYTLVLKGNIALSQAVFPYGTRGAQLDVLARLPMWKHGINFLHGTGHGVGHFLNVHEGPQSIRMNENPVPLLPGMLTSNEPGIYKEGKHGVRIENLLLTRKSMTGMFGDYLEFEVVTLCPICTKGIKREWLTADETSWLNHYHQKVFTALAPHLDEAATEWLRQATLPL